MQGVRNSANPTKREVPDLIRGIVQTKYPGFTSGVMEVELPFKHKLNKPSKVKIDSIADYWKTSVVHPVVEKMMDRPVTLRVYGGTSGNGYGYVTKNELIVGLGLIAQDMHNFIDYNKLLRRI